MENKKTIKLSGRMVEVDSSKKCCICGKTFYGWGNNPYPVKSEGVCCDDCNSEYVLSARIRALYVDIK